MKSPVRAAGVVGVGAGRWAWAWGGDLVQMRLEGSCTVSVSGVFGAEGLPTP